MLSRGDICWTDIPGAGRRPACVLTRQWAVPVLTGVTVASITSTVHGVESEVLLTRDDGMACDCVISLDNIHTVQRSTMSRPITRLSATKMYEVCRALDFAAGCR